MFGCGCWFGVCGGVVSERSGIGRIWWWGVFVLMREGGGGGGGCLVWGGS